MLALKLLPEVSETTSGGVTTVTGTLDEERSEGSGLLLFLHCGVPGEIRSENPRLLSTQQLEDS